MLVGVAPSTRHLDLLRAELKRIFLAPVIWRWPLSRLGNTRAVDRVVFVRLTFVASPARPGPTCRSRRGTAVAAEYARRRKPRSATAVSP